MATLAELDRLHRERHAPLFERAYGEVRRMTAAIALDTIHARRLHTLRTMLRRKIACNDATMLRAWLGEFQAAIDMVCEDAHRAADARNDRRAA